MSKKVIIIGAGPGGLSAAMLLAKQGFEVHIYEKEAVVGGRNAPLKLGPYTFDTGPTFLMMDFILRELFQEVGKDPDEVLNFIKLDPMYSLHFKDFSLEMTGNPEEMGNRLESIFPGAKEGYFKFLEREKKRFVKLYPCLQKPYRGFRDYLDLNLIKAVPYLGAGKSMFQELDNYFKEDELKLAFTFQSKYLGMSAWECPALFTMIPYVEHGSGIYHVEGGLNQISLKMKEVAEEFGATFHLQSPVSKILNEGKRLVGVELASGEIQKADSIFINADFAWAATNLFAEGALKKYAPEKVRKMKYSCSTWMLYLGLDKKYEHLPHHSIYFAENYKENIDDIFHNGVLTKNPSFYLQNASVSDATLAPEGHSALYVLIPTANKQHGIDWKQNKESLREEILGLIERKAGLKDLRSHIREEKIISPDEWVSDFNVFNGATFNLAHNFGQLLNFRPQNQFEEFENCFLVGGGTHPGSGLPTIYESARISSKLAIKQLSS